MKPCRPTDISESHNRHRFAPGIEALLEKLRSDFAGRRAEEQCCLWPSFPFIPFFLRSVRAHQEQDELQQESALLRDRVPEERVGHCGSDHPPPLHRKGPWGQDGKWNPTNSLADTEHYLHFLPSVFLTQFSHMSLQDLLPSRYLYH